MILVRSNQFFVVNLITDFEEIIKYNFFLKKTGILILLTKGKNSGKEIDQRRSNKH